MSLNELNRINTPTVTLVSQSQHSILIQGYGSLNNLSFQKIFANSILLYQSIYVRHHSSMYYLSNVTHEDQDSEIIEQQTKVGSVGSHLLVK